ncbi:hypothetical protein WJX84_003968 [Apatococcus fuscideae]|uniref:Uncharacterized protein n=1 Tax=Apatococcus fuscideae TaxID=2026836 RepID=A0AAW1TAY3_9CHLO
MSDLWEYGEPPPLSLASEDESEEDDVDPERCLPEAKRRKLMKRRGGRRVADTEVFEISDGEGNVAADIELRRQLAAFEKNSRAAEHEDPDEVITEPAPSAKHVAAVGDVPTSSQPSQQAEEAAKMNVWIQDSRGTKRKMLAGLLSVVFAIVWTATVAASVVPNTPVPPQSLVPGPAPALPGTQKVEHHKMSPWQTPLQSGQAKFPVIQAKCGDDLTFVWKAEKHGLFMLPSGICAEHFLDTPAIGLLELMPLTTDGNATIDLDEPGTFHFADPLYCGAPHHMIVEVNVRCRNELPRFSSFGFPTWKGNTTSQTTNEPALPGGHVNDPGRLKMQAQTRSCLFRKGRELGKWQQPSKTGSASLASIAANPGSEEPAGPPLVQADASPRPDRSLLASCIRASLASESLATKLFEGQRRIMKERPDLQLLQEQEQAHLNKLKSLAPEHRARPSLLAPALGALGSALGMVAAAAPQQLHAAITGGTQEALTEHYNDQLRDLRAAGLADTAGEFREVLRQLRDEERAPPNHAQVPDIMALRNLERMSVPEGVAGIVKFSVKGVLGLAYRALLTPLSDPVANKRLLALFFAQTLCSVATLIHDTYLPVYLQDVLGMSNQKIGNLQAIAQFLSNASKSLSGTIADIISPARMVIFGTLLTTLNKPMFAASGYVFATFGTTATLYWITAGKVFDRMSKGIREAPSKALIGELSQQSGDSPTAAFSLRQALATFGALVGSAIAGIAFNLSGRNYILTFALSTVPAVIALLITTAAFGKNSDAAAEAKEKSKAKAEAVSEAGEGEKLSFVQRAKTLAGALGPAYWEALAVVCLLYFARFDASFITLRAKTVMPKTQLPLLTSTMMLTQALLATFAGLQAKKSLGARNNVLLVGFLAMIGADLAFALIGSVPGMFLGATLVGVHMALTHGVSLAMVSSYIPATSVPGIGRVTGTCWSFTDFVFGIILAYSNSVAGRFADITVQQGQGNIGCFFGGAGATLLSGLALIVFARFGHLGKEEYVQQKRK